MKNIIKIVALTLVLAGGVFAQIMPIDTTEEQFVAFVGNQTSDGKFVEAIDQTMGNSFVLNGYNREHSSLLLTIGVDHNSQADFDLGNYVVGGSWNLAVYTNGTYVGSVFGDVLDGRIKYLSGGGKAHVVASKNTSATLRVNGGTGIYEGISSSSFARFDSDVDLANGETRASIAGLEF